MFRGTLLAFAIVCAAGAPAAAQHGIAQDGRDLAVRLCAPCHGIDSAERSPNATAPAFRHIEARVDFDELARRLSDGVIAGHPEMPAFVLRDHEARALVAYLRAIQAERR